MLIRLISWKEEVAKQHAALLQGAGFEVESRPPHSSGIVGEIRDLAPAAVVLDLDRLPSHGCAIANILRRSKSVCRIPLVFAGGAPDKVAAIRKEFPDAAFTSWEKVAPAIRKAAANPPVAPVRPAPFIERYSGAPLLKKLGIQAGLSVALVGAPDGFEDLLGELPDGVVLQTRMTKDTDMSIWFVRSHRELDVTADYLGARLTTGEGAWIIYPKQAGSHKVDFNMNDIRATMLEAGLVDYKICSVDKDWTALKFTRKK